MATSLPKPPHPRRHLIRAAIGTGVAALVLLLAVVFAALAISGRTLAVPVWGVVALEDRLNRALDGQMGQARLAVGGLALSVSNTWVPTLVVDDLRILKPTGEALLTLPEARVVFDPSAILRAELRPRSIRVVGGQIAVRRLQDGSFDIALGNGKMPEIDSLAQVFDAGDAVLALPVLSKLTAIDAEAVSLTLTDMRAGRTWTVGDGRMHLENRQTDVAAELGMTLDGGATPQPTGGPAQAILTIVSDKADSAARLTASVTNLAASDLASEVAPLAWLSLLDAPMSGNVSVGVDKRGLTALSAELDIGSGALHPNEGSKPVAFDHAHLQLAYNPEQGRLDIGALNVEGRSLRLRATGQSYLQDDAGHYLRGPLGSRLPQVFLTQVQISELKVDPEGLFSTPVTLRDGAVDLRLRLRPFSIDLGQLALADGATRILAHGTAGAGPAGWQLSLDASVNQIGLARLLALWPMTVAPKTRNWLVENARAGQISNATLALRKADGKTPAAVDLGFDFSGAEVRVVKSMPPVQAASGYARLAEHGFTLYATKAQAVPPQGGVVDLSGSVFRVPDVRPKAAPAVVDLAASGPLPAVLSLLDQPPLLALQKAGRGPDLGTGDVQVAAQLTLPLVDHLGPGDVRFTVAGRVGNFASDTLVPRRHLAIRQVTISGNDQRLILSGAGTLSQTPFDAVMSLPLTKDDPDPARIEGQVPLTAATLADLGVDLPAGMVTGEGHAAVSIDLTKGAPPLLTAVSDLNQLGLRIPGVGWSKAANQRGRLAVTATLGQPVQVTNLQLTAPGLMAEGRVDLNPNGTLDRVALGRLRFDWFDGPAEIVGRGPGKPVGINLTGGTVDLRKLPDDGASGGDAAPPAAKGTPAPDIPIRVVLKTLRVADDLALTGFSGNFSPKGGFNGSFSGRLNGIALIDGTVFPSAHGTAVNLTSQDAGAALASGGIFSSARGGTLEAQLLPRGPRGDYDATVTMQHLRVKNAPVLAELLSAVSIVGLLEQLNGEGLLFNRVSGVLRLTPDAVEITRGSAVGASLGVSAAGVYQTGSKALDLQGVISPIYLLNGIGAGGLTPRGEGIFGFNYSIKGTSDRTKVRVNPLSILTPWMLRDLIRGDAPNLGTTAP